MNIVLVKAIKNYILDCCDEERQDVINELARYKAEFPYEDDYNYYQYGNILPYYSQIRTFYENCGIKISEDNEVMLNDFKHNLRKAIDTILKEEERKGK